MENKELNRIPPFFWGGGVLGFFLLFQGLVVSLLFIWLSPPILPNAGCESHRIGLSLQADTGGSCPQITTGAVVQSG